MQKILFVHNHLSTFVRLDLAELQKHRQVTECYLRFPWVNPFALWRQVATHDLVFGWFASWHTFLPVLLATLSKKPSVLAVGGYDVAKMPEIGYGHHRGGLRRWISRRVMNLASRLTVPSQFSEEEAVMNAGVRRDRIEAIYLGVPDPFGCLPEQPRQAIALSVGHVNQSNLTRKGHEPFVRAAAFLPDIQFVLAGEWQDDAIDKLREIATPNVSFTGRLSEEQLLDYYRKSAVYVQPSLHEGFGLSVAEAMLAGCVPVITRAGSLPEVAGSVGEYLDSCEPTVVAAAIAKAMTYPHDARGAIRQRILEHFPMERRGQRLEQLIRPLLNGAH